MKLYNEAYVNDKKAPTRFGVPLMNLLYVVMVI